MTDLDKIEEFAARRNSMVDQIDQAIADNRQAHERLLAARHDLTGSKTPKRTRRTKSEISALREAIRDAAVHHIGLDDMDDDEDVAKVSARLEQDNVIDATDADRRLARDTIREIIGVARETGKNPSIVAQVEEADRKAADTE